MNILQHIFYLFKTTFEEFREDNATQMAAALSYYALFAVPPILLIILSILNIFLFGNQAQGTLILEAQEVLGPQVAETLELIISNLNQYSDQSALAQWIGIITLIVAATTAVTHLQRSLNTIWEIAPDPNRPLIFTVRQRVVSLAFIFSIGFLLLISFVANALLSILGSYVSELFGLSLTGLQIVNTVLSFFGVTLLISFIYRYLPEGEMSWRDILIGATVTAVFIAIGRYLIEIYLGRGAFGSAYGAAGSVLILILWVYYSSLIFFFGAEFTQVYSNVHGKGVQLGRGTITLREKTLLKQKFPGTEGKKDRFSISLIVKNIIILSLFVAMRKLYRKIRGFF